LQGDNGNAPVDLAELDAVLVRFSELVVEQPWIREVEINLAAGRKSLFARGIRVEVHGPEVRPDQLPKPAIRPYPIQYVSSWVMKDGQPVTIRPIRAEDEPLMIKFHERLSDRSVYLRYFQGMALDQRTTHDRLTRICFIDYDREIALVAERRDPHTEERRIIALGNLTKMHRGNDGEIAAITSDDCQGRGLGSEMMRRLLRIARDENLERIVATTLPENTQMCAMLKRLGFRVSVHLEDNLVEAEFSLRSQP
jgi:acetyltransferase